LPHLDQSLFLGFVAFRITPIPGPGWVSLLVNALSIATVCLCRHSVLCIILPFECVPTKPNLESVPGSSGTPALPSPLRDASCIYGCDRRCLKSHGIRQSQLPPAFQSAVLLSSTTVAFVNKSVCSNLGMKLPVFLILNATENNIRKRDTCRAASRLLS
jgi:hypothetical protein